MVKNKRVDFGAWLRERRKLSGLSLVQLSQDVERLSDGAMKLSVPHLSRIETGHRRPTRETCAALALALGEREDSVLKEAGLYVIPPSDLGPPAASRASRAILDAVLPHVLAEDAPPRMGLWVTVKRRGRAFAATARPAALPLD